MNVTALPTVAETEGVGLLPYGPVAETHYSLSHHVAVTVPSMSHKTPNMNMCSTEYKFQALELLTLSATFKRRWTQPGSVASINLN